MYNGIKLDGRTYDVRIVYGSIKRTFSIVEGNLSGVSIAKSRIRDIIGTEYAYQMQIEPVPSNMNDYYDFYEAISSPVSSHSFSAPYGNTELDFDCCIYSGTDTDMGYMAGERKWTGLTIVFEPLQPQRV